MHRSGKICTRNEILLASTITDLLPHWSFFCKQQCTGKMLAADSLCEISNMGRSCHVKNCKNSQRNAHVFSVNQEKANHFTEEFGYEFETRGTRVWICENHFEEDFISRYEYIFKDVNQNNIDKLINSPPPYEYVLRLTVSQCRGEVSQREGVI